MTECCCCDDSGSDSWEEDDDRNSNMRTRKFKASFFLTPEQVIELDKCQRGVNLLFNIEVDDSDDETRKQVELSQILDFYEQYWKFHGKELPAIEWDPFGRPYGVDGCGRLYGYDQMGLPFGYDECGIPFGYDRYGNPFGRRTYGLSKIPVNLQAGAGKYYNSSSSISSTSDSKSPSRSPPRSHRHRHHTRKRVRKKREVSRDTRSPSPPTPPPRISPKYSSSTLYPDRQKSRLFRRKKKHEDDFEEDDRKKKKNGKKRRHSSYPSKSEVRMTRSASSDVYEKNDQKAKEDLSRKLKVAMKERRRNKKKKKRNFWFS